MAVEVKRKQGESVESLVKRFKHHTLRSGIINQAKDNRFRKRKLSRRARRVSALCRLADRKKREYLIKIGRLK